jgi:hypothetical protein
MRTESARSTRLIRSDGSVVCACTYPEHRMHDDPCGLACESDLVGVRMRTRTQNACAARFRTVVVRACIATCEPKRVPWTARYFAESRMCNRTRASPASTLILAKRMSRVLIETPRAAAVVNRSAMAACSCRRSTAVGCRVVCAPLWLVQPRRPTVRRKIMRPFPGLHVADNTCASISAGLLAHYMRVRRCLCSQLVLACVGRLPRLHKCASAGRNAQGVRRCTSRCRPRIDADVDVPEQVERQIGGNSLDCGDLDVLAADPPPRRSIRRLLDHARDSAQRVHRSGCSGCSHSQQRLRRGRELLSGVFASWNRDARGGDQHRSAC